MLDSGANFNATASGWSSLQLSIIYGNKKAALRLLKNGSVDVNFQEARTHFSALHLAAKYNQEDVAKELIRRGAQIELTSEQSKTPLHVAAIANSLKVVELLLKSGANENARTADGDTALQLARKLKNKECEDVLENWMEDKTIDVRPRRRRPKLGVARSAAMKPVSLINNLIESFHNAFYYLTCGTITSFQSFNLESLAINLPLLSSEQMNNLPENSSNSNMNLNVNESLLLLNLISRKFTQQKTPNFHELYLSDLDARAIALNLTFSDAKCSFETYQLTYRQLINGYLQVF